jgi:hypothetical protein
MFQTSNEMAVSIEYRYVRRLSTIKGIYLIKKIKSTYKLISVRLAGLCLSDSNVRCFIKEPSYRVRPFVR